MQSANEVKDTYLLFCALDFVRNQGLQGPSSAYLSPRSLSLSIFEIISFLGLDLRISHKLHRLAFFRPKVEATDGFEKRKRRAMVILKVYASPKDAGNRTAPHQVRPIP